MNSRTNSVKKTTTAEELAEASELIHKEEESIRDYISNFEDLCQFLSKHLSNEECIEIIMKNIRLSMRHFDWEIKKKNLSWDNFVQEIIALYDKVSRWEPSKEKRKQF